MPVDPLINTLSSYTHLSPQELLQHPSCKNLKHDFSTFLNLLETAQLRVAQKDSAGQWHVNTEIKKIILLGFRLGSLVAMGNSSLPFIDKDTFPIQQFTPSQQVRLVPGGTSVRGGAYIAPSVTIMPPSYVNVGAFIDKGSMIDSHVLVGSCAQVGKNVHLSAGVQLGGVLEPIGDLPVIVEDDVFIGGNCGVYEGTLIGEQSVIGAGVILTRSSKVYDLVNEKILTATEETPLQIPHKAVVIAGSRQIAGNFAEMHGLAVQTPLIVKYRDSKTDAKTALEQSLRIHHSAHPK